MKSLKEHILEGILDIENNINYDMTEDVIEYFLKDNYHINGSYTIKKTKNSFIVNVKGNISVKNENITSLTDNLFKFNEVTGYFSCSKCNLLTSLEGAPERVGGNFYCDECKSLKTLKGAPEKVVGEFWCNYCKSLKTLEGAPEEVGDTFDCQCCGTKFRIEDVEKCTNVKGQIIV